MKFYELLDWDAISRKLMRLYKREANNPDETQVDAAGPVVLPSWTPKDG